MSYQATDYNACLSIKYDCSVGLGMAGNCRLKGNFHGQFSC